MADGGTITAADTGNPADNSDSGIDPVTGQPQTQGFKAWFKQHETLSLVIGAGVLLLTAILVFRKNQSGTPSGDLSGQATDTSGQTDNSGALAAAINALLNYLGSHSGDQQPPPGQQPPPQPTPQPGPPSPAPPRPIKPPGPPVPIQPVPGGHRKPPPGPPIPPGRKPPPGGHPPPVPPGKGGTGDVIDTSYSNDYATVAQWTPDNAGIQQSLSNITNGETSAVTRIENLFGGLGNGGVDQGAVVPFPGPLPMPGPILPWAPVPVGVPNSAIPSSPGVGVGFGVPGPSGPPPTPGPGAPPPPPIPGPGPGAPPPSPGRFRRMPWQRVP